MRRALPFLLPLGALVFGRAGSAQVVAPQPAPYVTPLPPAVPSTTVTPGGAAPTPAAEPPSGGAPAPPASAPGEAATPGDAVPVPPGAMPTQPPIIVEPPTGGVVPGGSQVLRVESALGLIAATSASPGIVTVAVDQDARTVTVRGVAVGTAVVTVTDARGQSRDVPVRVAELAGSIPSDVEVRITGDPATPAFIAERAVAAAVAAVQARPGAQIIAPPGVARGVVPLSIDDVRTVDVPVIVQGDAYFTVQGLTHVRVVNEAMPSVRPASLLVSDFPERLKANGVLFTADLTSAKASRFLYYHYNPSGQPDRRIVLLASNPSDEPATVQFISGSGGPGPNEMLVGHSSTEQFLVNLLQNEGQVMTVPAHTTLPVLAQPLPAGSVVSDLVQLHEISGATLHLTLLAQNASDPVSGTIPTSALLDGDVPHARGVYPIPEFFFDYRYDVQGPDLEMPIGQIPLPNLVHGQTLSGDYGVLQSLTVRMVNYSQHQSAQVALYANPRGGAATGTFVIDRELVQMHAVPPFARYKLRQYTIPPRAYVETEIVTMPEGGSSYPLRLEIAPDDGSVPPGQVGSPVY